METQPRTAFRDLLRHARRDAGLTQEELAERAGVSARTISDLERGVARAPRQDTCAMLISALDLSSADRMEWERVRRRLATRRLSNSARAASQTLQTSPHLPSPLTRFIGREREITDVAGLLRHPDVRLVTLTGVGGVGKTRLARAVAGELTRSYSDGVWFVNLAPLNSPDLVLATIATTLGLRMSGQQTPLRLVTSALQNKTSLLILDNVEQVAASAPDIKQVLVACPEVAILATSRIPLRLHGEHEYPLEPFDLPDLAREWEVDGIRHFPAVVLFAERAQAVRPEFQLTADNIRAVAEVCQRVDGLPLAIELAAARVRLMSPAAMLQRLEQRLPFLVGGTRDGPARHHSLYATIQWSYDLASPKEQRLFRALSVYVGGWTLDSAEAVVSEDTVDLLSALELLIEQSFIRVRELSDGSVRYAMLETIREFGLEQLESTGEGDAVRWLHATHFLALAEQAASFVEDGDREWLDRLDHERENLRAALNWLIERGETEQCLRLVASLRGLWFHRGTLSDGWAQLQAVLEMPGAALPTSARAAALATAAVLAIWRGDAAASIPLNSEALEICQALDLRTEQPWLLVSQGIAAARLGDDDRAAALWEQSLQLAREVGDHVNAARSLANISAHNMVDPRDADRRQAMLEEALALARSAGHPATIHLCLTGLVTSALDRGSYLEAAVGLQETLEISAASGWQWQLAEQVLAVARLAQATGQGASAAALISAHDALRERTGMALTPPMRARLDQFVREARLAMAADTYDAAQTAGRAMALEEAIALATNVLAIIVAPVCRPTTPPQTTH